MKTTVTSTRGLWGWQHWFFEYPRGCCYFVPANLFLFTIRGNGIQTWFLKEIELFIYYVKAPLRGLLKEIPENHLFHLGLETPACVLHLTQLSRLKQQNWKELYIRFQLTVSILYKSFFFIIFLWFTAHNHLTQPRPLVCPSVCPSVRQCADA